MVLGGSEESLRTNSTKTSCAASSANVGSERMRWQAPLTIGPWSFTSWAQAASLNGRSQSPARCGAASCISTLLSAVTPYYCRRFEKFAVINDGLIPAFAWAMSKYELKCYRLTLLTGSVAGPGLRRSKPESCCDSRTCKFLLEKAISK